MTVESIIKPLVDAMTANGESYTFYSISEWKQNEVADDSDLPVVFLTRPHKYQPKIVTGGGYRQRYYCTVLILFKDSFENTEEQKNAIYEKATLAQRELHIRLDNSNLIENLEVEQCPELEHLMDSDLSGVMMPFSFDLKVNNSVCL